MNDSAYPDTTVWNTAVVWGTGPNAKSKDFCYSYCYTLFQIILETVRDKGMHSFKHNYPSVQDYDTKHISGVQVSKLYPFTLISVCGGLLSSWMDLPTPHSLETVVWGHQGTFGLAYKSPLGYVQLTLQGAIAATEHGAGLGQSNQSKISL